nr:hypothetical protein [Duganella vulcania]
MPPFARLRTIGSRVLDDEVTVVRDARIAVGARAIEGKRWRRQAKKYRLIQTLEDGLAVRPDSDTQLRAKAQNTHTILDLAQFLAPAFSKLPDAALVRDALDQAKVGQVALTPPHRALDGAALHCRVPDRGGGIEVSFANARAPGSDAVHLLIG